ncbi:sugar phosphate isomerase/epimerase family protein [Streptosporangium sp. NBC_01756]|uniref:sugar phosphate isomerase/epimerase family protein n=1 Tax=Streptosporangium sp. NBC_01756 TaxID=2975950 RepID=UPI002DD92AE6|nr:sugar phosphate isomerase/epimerase family protein [Streptosporangium sp. NBC_01756]WSC87438.1 sugar phosphate isomerase/epimerase [Streptosporangium sp. NBC_01756]
MKLSFSTLGLPGAGLSEAIEIAAAHRCDGLELRLHPDTGVHVGLPGAGARRTEPPASGVSGREGRAAEREGPPADRPRVRAALAAAGLEISALAGYTGICAPGDDGPVVETLTAELVLAADLGAPGVRVFPKGDDRAVGARRLRAVAATARRLGVRVLVETHDAMPTGAAVARLLDETGDPEVTGAIWDLLHPWRHGEDPADTLAALGEHLAYVQVKDAGPDGTPVPMGQGAVPLEEAGTLLREREYDGWVSLEWERTWYPHVAPVQEVIPGAAAWVRRFS